MTNLQIIAGEVLTRGIAEPVDTYQGWLRKGMQVTKGSKALFQTRIWKPCKSKDENEDGEKRMILVKASFFGLSQVEAREGGD